MSAALLEMEDLPQEIRALDAACRLSRSPLGEAGGQVAWREWGQGEPLLLLHGSHGGWMHWLRNIPELAKGRRVIAPDLPGFGDSDAPADPDSPADHGRPLGEGLRTLAGINAPIDMIAFSLGALIGCHMTIDFPGLIRRMIIVDGGGLGTPVITADNRSMKGLSGQALRDMARHNLGAAMIHDPAQIDETAIDISLYYGRRVRTRVMHQVIPDKLLAVVQRVRTPIDAIWGEFDNMHPDPELNAEAIRAFQPEAQLRVVRGAGHWPMYEQPAVFNAAALELLSHTVRPHLPATSMR